MKFAVTGATGYVGSMLVPLLKASGHDVFVCGRDLQKLNHQFPDCETSNYADIKSVLKDVDAVVHLAVLNNDKFHTREAFFATNVDLTLQIARAARDAGVAKFIFVSSTHALNTKAQNDYAESKREAAKRLQEIDGIDIDIIHLAAVYGNLWPHKLAFLNALSPTISRAIFRPLAALRPTVHVSKIADYLNTDGKSFHKVPAQYQILADDIEENAYYRFFRSIVDLAVVLSVCLLFGWLILGLWLLIKLDSAGPGIFSQSRVGKGGALFTCYKLRTMKLGTANLGTHETAASQITRLGSFLRKFKIDEAPQVINLLRGEMTLVGPRPCLPVQTELIAERDKCSVLDILPGITGYSQVRGIDMSEPVKLSQSDAEYMRLRSILLDVKIIVATLIGRGFGDRVAK